MATRRRPLLRVVCPCIACVLSTDALRSHVTRILRPHGLRHVCFSFMPCTLAVLFILVLCALQGLRPSFVNRGTIVLHPRLALMFSMIMHGAG